MGEEEDEKEKEYEEEDEEEEEEEEEPTTRRRYLTITGEVARRHLQMGGNMGGNMPGGGDMPNMPDMPDMPGNQTDGEEGGEHIWPDMPGNQGGDEEQEEEEEEREEAEPRESSESESESGEKEDSRERDSYERDSKDSYEDDKRRPDSMKGGDDYDMSTLGKMFYMMLRGMFEDIRNMSEDDIRELVRYMDVDYAVEYDCLGEDYFVKVGCSTREGCYECDREEKMEVFPTNTCMEEFSGSVTCQQINNEGKWYLIHNEMDDCREDRKYHNPDMCVENGEFDDDCCAIRGDATCREGYR